jgi:O-antigen ligase
LPDRKKILWLYVISFLFIALNSVLIIKEFYWAIFIPVALFVGWMYIFSLDKLLLLIVFLTPLAVNIRDMDMGVGISLPTEPLLFGVLLLFVLKLMHNVSFDKKVLKHPLTLAIAFHLIWMLFTSFTSSIPLVSFKYFVSRLWFVIPFYFLGSQLFRDFKNIKRFSWAYVIPLLGVIAYTIYNHALHAFDEEAGHWVMTPFFNDHTAYGAMIAFFIPVFVFYIFDKASSRSIRFFTIFVTVVLLLALILSFSRAAWISVAVAIVVYIVVLLKIKFRWLFLGFAGLLVIFFSFQFEILDKLEKNTQDSSGDLVEHLRSISNISSDASNLERINRWQSAIRMFHERPVLGWGPGTYQFQYAPFQRMKEKTIISTNAGDMGNAHSEFIGPLAESGVLGMISMLLIVIIAIYTGLKIHKRARSKKIRQTALITLLALITYFVHGLLNNFLDTDKASVPVWAFFAIILALDIYHMQELDPPAEKPDLTE